ncbi:beta-N-acetylhexosaminidase [Streptomyces sp. ODS28]|uniref:beta-N-acetylhexosaminidase n=1 Tax=Streptomyces sp. ODS28 TaxID=3136688 RepID=UPI0031EEF668
MRRLGPLVLCAALLSAALPAAALAAPGDGGVRESAGAPRPLDRVVPAPASVRQGGPGFSVGERTPIRVSGDSAAARRAGEQLAALLRPSTGYRLPVTSRPGPDGIRLRLTRGGAERARLGDEGYRLAVDRRSVDIAAPTGAGLFHGVQTLRQLLPAEAEARSKRPGPWRVAGGTITDRPRYPYRGAMLDVSRHFLEADQVKRYIDHLALYKVNKLHLHLSDDQGWRIALDSWPRLASYGGSTEVGGGKGGYYTKSQYREIVRYAAERHLTVVPEIDMPGHTNAALASYAALNCDGKAPPLYTGTEVGFSSLCVKKEITYDFVDDVVREIAALTPGRYLHIGGDEAHATSHEDYAAFMARAQRTVRKYGKTVVGWHQITGAEPVKGAVAQYWGTTGKEKEVVDAAKRGTRLILSPANRAYMDMKYNKDTPYGLSWAGYVEARQSYDWDPGSYVQGAPGEAVLGVEAPMWTETLERNDQIDYMAFPRLPGIAELGWSRADRTGWDDYRQRIAEQAPRWEELGITYYRSPEIPWSGQ